MGILDFFSREAGQQRRRWLDETVGDAIEYFIPPNLRPAAEFIAEANPVQAMGNAMSAGGVVFDPDQTREARLRAAGDMGLEMAMTLAPAALVRMGYLAAPAGLLETFATPSADAAVDIGQGILSDATYAARSGAEGDPRGVLEAFQRGGQPQSLSVASKAEELRRQANIQRFGYDPNEAQAVDTSYRISHQPSGPKDENPIRLDDLTKTVTGETAGYPEDFYGNQGARIYAPPRSFADDEYGIANEESYDVIRSVRNDPDAEVTIYRAVPDSDDINTINEGDWITLSPKYAEVHAASGYGRSGDEAGKVISKKVRVKDIYWAGDDVNEFGYFPDTSTGVRDLFPEKAYHFMKSNRMIGDVLRPPSDYASKFDRLGVHVGTPAQAEDRYKFQVGTGSREDIDRDLTLLGKDTGMTLPLQLRTEKPFEIKDFKEFGIDPDVSHSSRSFEIGGKTVLSEDGVRAVLNEFADARNLDLDTALDVFRKELTDKGYTNIPYVNMIEGVRRSETYDPDPKFKAENISNIMLVDRTAGDPAVIKSRFAAFRDAYDPSIMAAVPIGGLLGYNMLSQQQAERNNQGLLY